MLNIGTSLNVRTVVVILDLTSAYDNVILLFELYCNFLKDVTPEGWSILGDEEDFTVIGRGSDTIRSFNILSQMISTEFLDRDMRMSPGKCTAMCCGNNGYVNTQ